jgi:hypothetical protein
MPLHTASAKATPAKKRSNSVPSPYARPANFILENRAAISLRSTSKDAAAALLVTSKDGAPAFRSASKDPARAASTTATGSALGYRSERKRTSSSSGIELGQVRKRNCLSETKAGPEDEAERRSDCPATDFADCAVLGLAQVRRSLRLARGQPDQTDAASTTKIPRPRPQSVGIGTRQTSATGSMSPIAEQQSPLGSTPETFGPEQQKGFTAKKPSRRGRRGKGKTGAQQRADQMTGSSPVSPSDSVETDFVPPAEEDEPVGPQVFVDSQDATKPRPLDSPDQQGSSAGMSNGSSLAEPPVTQPEIQLAKSSIEVQEPEVPLVEPAEVEQDHSTLLGEVPPALIPIVVEPADEGAKERQEIESPSVTPEKNGQNGDPDGKKADRTMCFSPNNSLQIPGPTRDGPASLPTSFQETSKTSPIQPTEVQQFHQDESQPATQIQSGERVDPEDPDSTTYYDADDESRHLQQPVMFILGQRNLFPEPGPNGTSILADAHPQTVATNLLEELQRPAPVDQEREAQPPDATDPEEPKELQPGLSYAHCEPSAKDADDQNMDSDVASEATEATALQIQDLTLQGTLPTTNLGYVEQMRNEPSLEQVPEASKRVPEPEWLKSARERSCQTKGKPTGLKPDGPTRPEAAQMQGGGHQSSASPKPQTTTGKGSSLTAFQKTSLHRQCSEDTQILQSEEEDTAERCSITSSPVITPPHDSLHRSESWPERATGGAALFHAYFRRVIILASFALRWIRAPIPGVAGRPERFTPPGESGAEYTASVCLPARELIHDGRRIGAE